MFLDDPGEVQRRSEALNDFGRLIGSGCLEGRRLWADRLANVERRKPWAVTRDEERDWLWIRRKAELETGAVIDKI